MIPIETYLKRLRALEQELRGSCCADVRGTFSNEDAMLKPSNGLSQGASVKLATFQPGSFLMIDIAKISLLVYAALVAVGGIMGFVKAQSKASLIAGVVSAILVGICYAVATMGPDAKVGLGCALAVCVVLSGVFALRLAKTKKFMPSGLMLIFSGLEEVLLLLAITA